MKVIIKEPGEPIGHFAEIDNTLEAMQEIVGGYIETITFPGFVIVCNEEGKLISVGKVRGRKAAIQGLAKKLEELGLPGKNESCFISHGDCPEDAETLATIIREKYGVRTVITSYIGAVIGSHSGPGTLALFFLGAHR